MAVEIIYETHSTTTDNEAGIATGWLPGRLSAAGRAQARALGERRRDDVPAAVFASDLARAIETADIAFAGSGVPVHRDARLRECNYGDLNGAPVGRLAVLRRGRVDAPFPSGESYRQVVDRTRGFLRDLAVGWDGTTLVLIAHSANLLALECLLNGRDLHDLVSAPFRWRPGWRYVLPAGWTGAEGTPVTATSG